MYACAYIIRPIRFTNDFEMNNFKNVDVCIYVYVYIYIYIYIYTYTHIHTYLHELACSHTYRKAFPVA